MLEIDILTAVPNLVLPFLQESIVKRSQDKGLVKISVHNLRNWAINDYGQIDDIQYGGGAGMVLRCEPLYNAINELHAKKKFQSLLLTSPCGIVFNQKLANNFSLQQKILFICGHYKGVDERIKSFFPLVEISLGDFVLTGGELPALVFIDAIIRLIPGVLNDETSALLDSFQDNLLAPPLYTRPANFKNQKVPEILLQGNPKLINEWQYEQSLKKTSELRPDLLKKI